MGQMRLMRLMGRNELMKLTRLMDLRFLNRSMGCRNTPDQSTQIQCTPIQRNPRCGSGMFCLLTVGFLLMTVCHTAIADTVPSLSTLDLVADDVALCLELPDLNTSWSKLESGPLMDRLRDFPPFRRLLASPGFQQWQMIEEHVNRQTGSKLSVQLRALFGRSLVIAIYVPADGKPRGILIGEAMDAASIETALSTWNKLEPTEVTSNRSHRSHRYVHRKKSPNTAESAFIVTSDRWFAISDHESLIHDVIDRLIARSAPNAIRTNSSPGSSTVTQNLQKLNNDAMARAFINARPWDRGLEEVPRNANDPIDPAAVWRYVRSVSASLQLDQGVVCEAAIELETSRLPDGWSDFVSVASGDSSWIRRVPADALLATGSRFDIRPVVQHILNLMPTHDRNELAKVRRLAQSLFGGNDLLDTVLPSLARDVGGYLTTRTDGRTHKVTLDGAVGFSIDSPGDARLLADVDHGLDTGLSLLAGYLSFETPSLVTVLREQNGTTSLRSLSDAVPFPIAYGIQGSHLVLAGSRERLVQSLETLDQPLANSRLEEHSRRLFPGTNQLIWFDAARTRDVVQQHGSDLAGLFARGSANEAAQLLEKLDRFRQHLGVTDSIFIAGRMGADNIRIVFGGGLDSR